MYRNCNNEPFEYARMVLDGTMQDYIDKVDGIGQSQLRNYVELLSERYPKNIAEDIAKPRKRGFENL